jgi:hypothetical protein
MPMCEEDHKAELPLILGLAGIDQAELGPSGCINAIQ